MQIQIICEKENDDNTFSNVSLKTAKKLLESGKYYSENLNFGIEFLHPNEIFRFTLMKMKDIDYE